jgi:hypothetical protein
MALAVNGGEPQPWADAFTLAVSEPVWAPDGTRFAALVADPSVTDPEIEPSKPGMYSIAQPFMDLYLVQADGASRNITGGFTDQVSNPVWSTTGDAVFFRAIHNTTYDETLYRYTVADRKLEPIARGQESYSRVAPATAGLLTMIEEATRPADLWLVTAPGSRTRVTDLNPQLARFTFSKPELFTFDNADGERLGALLYKPAGLGPADRVPVITWVYEKMTPAIHRFDARHQMYISHGYAMLMPNVKVKVGQTADSFEKCVVPAVNAVRQMGFTNGRFGLWGHSFGAYATSNLITRTDIFAAAVSGATPPELFRNWASGRDRDSRNIETGQARMGGSCARGWRPRVASGGRSGPGDGPRRHRATVRAVSARPAPGKRSWPPRVACGRRSGPGDGPRRRRATVRAVSARSGPGTRRRPPRVASGGRSGPGDGPRRRRATRRGLSVARRAQAREVGGCGLPPDGGLHLVTVRVAPRRRRDRRPAGRDVAAAGHRGDDDRRRDRPDREGEGAPRAHVPIVPGPPRPAHEHAYSPRAAGPAMWHDRSVTSTPRWTCPHPAAIASLLCSTGTAAAATARSSPRWG